MDRPGLARLVPLLALLACSVLPGGACTLPPTQLLVVVDSDYGRGEIAQVEVRTYEVNARDQLVGEQTVFIVEGSEAGVTIPFSFGVVPVARDASRRVVIELTALERGAAGGRVQIRAITGFVRHETRRLPMFIGRMCVGRVCDPEDTCNAAGMCVPAGVDPGPAVVPGEEFQDAGHSSMDAGIDAFAPDAYRDDVYVPPGVDADLDAAPDPDAFVVLDAFVEPDAFVVPDAFVPPGADADFPDAWSPDAFVLVDAFSFPDAGSPDALTFRDAGADAPSFFDASVVRDAGVDAPPDAHDGSFGPMAPDGFELSSDAPFLPTLDGAVLDDMTCDAACPDGMRCMVSCL
jgi:hypothetical protein